jgi:UDPglucose 6-dehydrogenase
VAAPGELFMRVTVVGLGYVGLVTAACLARLGHRVVGLEIDETKLGQLMTGRVPYYEPGLDDEVERQWRAGNLTFVGLPSEAFRNPEAVLICVGTPSDEAGRADLQYVRAAAEAVGREIDIEAGSRPVVALRSTVPAGTTRAVERQLNDALRARGVEAGVAVLTNPEFLRTGRAVEDFLRPTRVVVGRTELATDEDVDRLRALYQSMDAPMIVTDAESAELIKNAANAFLATKISFVNELAQLCAATGATVDDVIAGIATDPRIGGDFLRPGLGYGGSCLPKDVRSLISMGDQYGRPMQLAKSVDAINRDQPQRYVRALAEALGGSMGGRRIAVLGLAFKPDTDDLRDSPAIGLAKALTEAGAQVVGCDPVANAKAGAANPWLEIADTPEDAARGADAVVLATEWPVYVTIDPGSLAAVMRGRVVLDGRNVLDPKRYRAAGLTYLGVGRRAESPATIPA